MSYVEMPWCDRFSPVVGRKPVWRFRVFPSCQEVRFCTSNGVGKPEDPLYCKGQCGGTLWHLPLRKKLCSSLLQPSELTDNWVERDSMSNMCYFQTYFQVHSRAGESSSARPGALPIRPHAQHSQGVGGAKRSKCPAHPTRRWQCRPLEFQRQTLPLAAENVLI